jgi:hypothetical protein
MQPAMPAARSLLGGRRSAAAAASLLCLLLALLVQAADFVHEHPERLGCDVWHPASGQSACRPSAHLSRLLAAPARDEVERGGACLVCRWSRGPLLHERPQASLGAPQAPRRSALRPQRQAPRLPGRAGFLDRAPPSAA